MDEVYREILNKSPIGYAYHKIILKDGKPTDFIYIDVNEAFENLLGLSKKSVIGKKFTELFPGIENDEFDWIGNYGRVALEGITLNFEQYSKLLDRWYRVLAFSPERMYFVTFFVDITREKNIIKRLETTLKKQQILFYNSQSAIAYCDKNGSILEANDSFLKLFGYDLEDVLGKNIDDIVSCPTNKDKVIDITKKVFIEEFVKNSDYRCKKDGTQIYVEIQAVLVKIDNNLDGCFAIYRDLTKEREESEKLEYYSFHDELTGLYNRRYFFEEVERIKNGRSYPISFISVDVDGLKVINDVFGHSSGDLLLKTSASVLRTSIRSEDILARVGGDEFLIMVPNSNDKIVENIVQRIKLSFENYNKRKLTDIYLSFSIGYATANNSNEIENALKLADERLYSEKIKRKKEYTDILLEEILVKLELKDNFLSVHCKRMERLLEKVESFLNLSDEQKVNLKLLIKYHDIGKLLIPEELLLNSGTLNEDEKKIVMKHSEFGYRMAFSFPKISQIADLILKHHERWDGKGYPLGIADNEIPLECRIISLLESIDLMANGTPYHRVKTKKEIIDELIENKGKQFDPELVEIFVKVLDIA